MKAIQTHDLNCWDEYRPLIQSIREEYGRFKVTEDYSKKNVVLFRGHASDMWHLETTLERCTNASFSIADYIEYASRCSSELESFTGKKWDIPPLPDLEREIREKQDHFRVHLPCYNYLVYLRHHGFPSPLLDWTVSPFIAAYFAYIEAHSDDRVAVYAYIERPKGIKGGTGGLPQIKLLGPYVTTDSRHFAQKAWYTVATKYEDLNEQHVFCSHISVFSQGIKNQDILIKITMPSRDRLKALAELSDYNIDHFTLFQTEDSLVKAMALKVFELDKT